MKKKTTKMKVKHMIDPQHWNNIY